MAINQQTITRNIGPANIYVDCTKPAALTPIALGAGGVPTGGRDLGATQGESTFRYTPTIEGVEAEQVFGLLAPHMVREDAQITCTLLEATYENLLVAFSQGTGTTGGGVNRIGFGGKTDVPRRCVALVAKSADQDTYDVAVLYDAIAMQGVTLPKQRGQPTRVQVTFTGVPDHSRPSGDQVAQWLEDVVPA